MRISLYFLYGPCRGGAHTPRGCVRWSPIWRMRARRAWRLYFMSAMFSLRGKRSHSGSVRFRMKLKRSHPVFLKYIFFPSNEIFANEISGCLNHLAFHWDTLHISFPFHYNNTDNWNFCYKRRWCEAIFLARRLHIRLEHDLRHVGAKKVKEKSRLDRMHTQKAMPGWNWMSCKREHCKYKI